MTKWVDVAKKLIGTREIAGTANSPTIMGWAKKLGTKIIGMVYTADSTPWCGLFCAYVFNEVGIAPPPVAVRATAWSTWGVGLKVPLYGCVVVFLRKGGGHVGIIVGETKTHYLVLGGNQGDTVSEALIAKERAFAFRWPTGVPIVKTPPPLVNAAGRVITTNEQ